MAQYVIPSLLIAVAILFSGLGIFSGTEQATLYLLPQEASPDESPLTLDVMVKSSLPINVVSGTLSYPKDVMSISVEEATDDTPAISLWLTEPTVNPETGTIPFAGGVGGETLGEEARLFTITVSTTSDAAASITFSDIEVFANDGQGTKLTAGGEEYVVTPEPVVVIPVQASSASAGDGVLTSRSDFDESGHVSLSDLSILLIHMVNPYDATYDIDNDGAVNLKDLSIVITKLGQSVPEPQDTTETSEPR